MIKIDVLLGFLDSGKTTLINSLISKENNEKIYILQQEDGKEKLNYKYSRLTPKITSSEIEEIVNDFSPDRIIIELNGMEDIDEFLEIFHDKHIKAMCEINKIITTIDAKKANNYFMNMAQIIRRYILNSDIVVLTKGENINKKDIRNIKNNIKSINEIATIHYFNNIEEEKSKVKKREFYSQIDKHSNTLFYIMLSLCILVLIGFCFNLGNIIYKDKSSRAFLYDISINFLGMFIETVPFILIGAFVSSILQVYISDDMLIKLIPKNKILSSIFASILGIVFPICDCGTIPVARGFIKKGLPINVAITFMLSAPIVNPIAIASSVYVFSDMPEIIISRIIIGVLIAIVVGLLLNRYSPSEIASDYIVNCQCNLCQGKILKDISKLDRIKSVILLSSDEFFNVSKYMIVGVLLSSIMQKIFSLDTVNFTSSSKIGSILIMMVVAFMLSVCSTSDSFIAKGFLKNFTKVSVVGFLVLGPMIDIKNTFMLIGSFKKEFVLKLMILTMGLTFLSLMVINI
ncbi:MAG: permease [Clostridiaceae bacterium]|nr:permease [Clostridiaceae bacterium]